MKKIGLLMVIVLLVGSASATVLQFPTQVTVQGVATNNNDSWGANNSINGSGLMTPTQARMFNEPSTYNGVVYNDGTYLWSEIVYQFDQAYEIAEIDFWNGGYIHKINAAPVSGLQVEVWDSDTSSWAVFASQTLSVPYVDQLGGIRGQRPDRTPYTHDTFLGRLFTADVIPLGVTTDKIRIRAIDQDGDVQGGPNFNPYIDPGFNEIQFVLTPEPATMLLFGLGGLLLRRKRS